MPAANLDQQKLLEAAVREGTAAFQKAVDEYPGEEIYAICFYTDNDVTSVYPTANSVEGLRRTCDGEDPDDLNYYKWAPAEWNLVFGQFDRPDLMAETNKLLYPTEFPEESGEVFGRRKQKTIETLSRALLQIKQSGIFRGQANADRIACFVNIGDADDGEIAMMFAPVIDHLPGEVLAEVRRLFDF